ncbi:MAG: UDP-N-acetylmuramoyl-tripeptide--D-alanyl-D-alanine ligase [Coriobacteriales bacterium]|nr:UDP-N-acetylmuramoyl-tripeptide--D-alanyl-D-alanine ligase [Coriobacteriales bacterium]
MLTITVETLVDVVGGELVVGSPDAVVNGIVVDSRAVELGSAFLALPGENVDGHDFLQSALERGARGLFVTRTAEELGEIRSLARARGAAIVRVDDGLTAIQALASFQRSRLHCPVIAVTGSTGKTTTKDFIDCVLATEMRVVSTVGNRNNELGLPLTILDAGMDTDVLVVEMGMRGEGQIAALAEIARPTAGIVTNIGQTHIELLGTQEAIANAKGELVAAIPADGTVFLNGDDGHSEVLASMATAAVTYYGLGEHADVRALDVEVDAESRATFTLAAPEVRIPVRLPVPGRHNVYNALAAAAVGLYLGLTPEQVVRGLETARTSDMRMEVFTTASGVTIVNDAYNANPTSMRAAVETLAEMQADNKRIAVLGDMAELGSLTELAHFHIGEAIAELPIDVLITVGTKAGRIADGAKAAGMAADSVVTSVDAEDALKALEPIMAEGDVVLVKASRVMGLERVVEGIVQPG